MPKAHATWKVLPHGPIEKLTERVWRVEGSLPDMPLRRVMTIVRRSDGRLVVHNAMALDDSLMAAIDAWGPVRTIIVPSAMHRLDAGVYHARYPEASVVCPRGGRDKVAEVVPVSATLEEVPADPAVELQTLDGTRAREGAMIIRDAGGTTLVLNDAVFNMPHLGGVQGLLLKHITGSSGGPRVSRLARLLLVKDRPAFRAHLERLAQLPDLRRIIVSHHEVITEDPAGTLARVAATV